MVLLAGTHKCVHTLNVLKAVYSCSFWEIGVFLWLYITFRRVFAVVYLLWFIWSTLSFCVVIGWLLWHKLRCLCVSPHNSPRAECILTFTIFVLLFFKQHNFMTSWNACWSGLGIMYSRLQMTKKHHGGCCYALEIQRNELL